MDIVTHVDDIDDVRGYQAIWPSGDAWKRHRFDVQENGEWVITEEVHRAGVAGWQIELETRWPYPFAPVVHCQNLPVPNDVWGMSDLEEADINDAINFTASNIARILKFHAHPKTIGTGFAFNQLQQTAVDEFWAIPSADAKVFNLEMQSELAAAYTYLAELKQLYSKVTGVPDLDPAQVNVGALSGFALRILYGDLLEATNTKRNTYGALLSEVNARVLAVGGMAEYGTMDVRNVWPDPLPNNGIEQAQTLQIDRAHGLSMETYLTRRGYDVEQESERRGAEDSQRATLGEDLLRSFERGGTMQ
jgi:FAD/FMN-containing dehydrogenase